MTVPTRSIDRKLDRLKREIERQRQAKPPGEKVDGLTSTASTKDKDVPNIRRNGNASVR